MAPCIRRLWSEHGRSGAMAVGFLADRNGVQHALPLPALCYLFILYDGLHGS